MYIIIIIRGRRWASCDPWRFLSSASLAFFIVRFFGGFYRPLLYHLQPIPLTATYEDQIVTPANSVLTRLVFFSFFLTFTANSCFEKAGPLTLSLPTLVLRRLVL